MFRNRCKCSCIDELVSLNIDCVKYMPNFRFGFLHSAKNLVCAARNYGLRDGQWYMSMKVIVQLWNNNTCGMKSILSANAGIFKLNICINSVVYQS